MSKIYVSWEDISRYVAEVKDRYSEENLTGVYGIPRGGAVLAVMVSHALNIPTLAAPCKGCLVVDDICDTGESLLHFMKNTSGEESNGYHIATVYYKENALGIKPEYYSHLKGNDWIVFPWEMEEYL